MKKILIVIAILFSLKGYSQYTTRSGSLESSGYGVLSTQFSRFNGQNAIFAGAYGGWMIHHRLMIGIGGYGLATRHPGYGVNVDNGLQNDWKMGYGGLMLEYTFPAGRYMHVSANTLIGGGFIKNGIGRGTIPENGSDELEDIDASGFAVLQPGVTLEYSVTNWFRMGAGVGYRFIRGSNQKGISDAQMSAPTACLSFKFGIF